MWLGGIAETYRSPTGAGGDTEEAGMPADHRVDLETSLRRVIERLQRRFDLIDPSVVEATVRCSAAEFRDARLPEFIPVFVEGHSAEALQRFVA
jgi:hypothetical protein